MELLNSIANLLCQGWSYYFGTMMDFKAAYPVLAFFTFLGLQAALVYLAVKKFSGPKPERKVFDIKARIENPAWFIKGIIYVLERCLIPLFTALELLVKAITKGVFGLYIFGLKVYFSVQLKIIKLSKY